MREVNDRLIEVELIALSEDDLDLGQFNGADAIQALAALDGVLLK